MGKKQDSKKKKKPSGKGDANGSSGQLSADAKMERTKNKIELTDKDNLEL